MAQRHTYCFRYKNKYYKICYIWIEAINEDVAKLKFEQECTDCIKLIDIKETFNWQCENTK